MALVPQIADALRCHRLQAGVGHYGMFSGKRWNGQIYPVIRNLVLVMY